MPLKLKKRGEIWYYSGTVNGWRLRGSTKTALKDQAQIIANEIERRYLQGGRDPASVLTFAQAAIEYRRLGKAPRYLELVEDHWKDTPVKDITRGAVKRAAITLFPTQKGATRNRSVIVPTLAVINHAASLDMCPPLRVDWFPTAKVTKAPATWEWVEAFMAHSSPHLAALACFMFMTGARVSEALSVTWADVDLGAARVVIRQGKLGGEERRAHMPAELVSAIANIPSNREPGAAVFQYSTYHTAKWPWFHAAKRAGIAPLTFHSCRHGFATGLLHQKVDPITVARLGGWKSAQHVFATYGHAMADDTLADRLTGKPQAQLASDDKKDYKKQDAK